MATTRGTDRRQLNISAEKERRGSGTEKRRCPDCKGALKRETKQVSGGTVLTLSCASCGWAKSSRQTDSSVLMAKLTWALPLEKSGGSWSASFPAELADSLKLKPGDELVLSPLTLPVGSLPMRWALTVSRKTSKKK